jgi:hypothetical protein
MVWHHIRDGLIWCADRCVCRYLRWMGDRVVRGVEDWMADNARREGLP